MHDELFCCDNSSPQCTDSEHATMLLLYIKDKCLCSLKLKFICIKTLTVNQRKYN